MINKCEADKTSLVISTSLVSVRIVLVGLRSTSHVFFRFRDLYAMRIRFVLRYISCHIFMF